MTGCSQSSYEDIVCEENTYFENTYFSEKSNSDILCIDMPKKWNYQKDDEGYMIVEYSQEIGSVEFLDGNK